MKVLLVKWRIVLLHLPCASKLDNNSKQPMASAFEQLSFMTYDAIVMELMTVLNQDADDMFQSMLTLNNMFVY